MNPTSSAGISCSNSGEVEQCMNSIGSACIWRFSTVPLAQLIPNIGGIAFCCCRDIVLDLEGKLNTPAIALVKIDTIVSTKEVSHILHVHRATEMLNTVVGVVRNIDELKQSSAAHCPTSETIDLIVWGENKATVTDGYETQRSAVVVIG